MTDKVPAAEAPATPQEAAARFLRGPKPDWVEPIEAPEAGSAEGATGWILLDEQIDLRAPARRFIRQAQQANNESGVDFLSEIRIQFNPSYETLTLHGVEIRRGEERIDALDDADIDFLRLEQDMYARIYRGDYVVVIQVRGLEPQDRIEYSYTIEGQNPVFGGGVALITGHTFGAPLARRFCRVIHDADQPPLIHAKGPQQQILETRVNGALESRLDLVDQKRFDFEFWVPAEFDDQASTWFLSSFRSWSDVANWAAELYEVAPDDAAVAELTERFRSQNAQAPELAAIAHVQDRIRYVSTCFGEGGYRPRAPQQVVKRRYGDCKDKALLLSAVLRKLGHEADVALVCARRPRGPLAEPPTPLAFDHVVVRAVINGKTHWIDATATGQRGPLELRGRPHALAALLIRRGVGALELLPQLPDAIVGDRSEGAIDLSAGVGAPVMVSGESTSVGIDAENMRRNIAVFGAEGLARMYLDASSQDHGETVHEEFEVKDDEATNTVTIRQRSRLLDPWRAAPGGLKEFRSTLCYATTLLPATPMNGRTRPVQILEHPLHHAHSEVVQLPRGKRPVGVKSRTEHRVNTAFEFKRNDTLNGDVLKVEVETRTLAPYFEADAALGALRDQTVLQQGHVLQLAFKSGGLGRLFGRG